MEIEKDKKKNGKSHRDKDLYIIANILFVCTGLRSFPEKIIQEIFDNLTIKDIIE